MSAYLPARLLYLSNRFNFFVRVREGRDHIPTSQWLSGPQAGSFRFCGVWRNTSPPSLGSNDLASPTTLSIELAIVFKDEGSLHKYVKSWRTWRLLLNALATCRLSVLWTSAYFSSPNPSPMTVSSKHPDVVKLESLRSECDGGLAGASLALPLHTGHLPLIWFHVTPFLVLPRSHLLQECLATCLNTLPLILPLNWFHATSFLVVPHSHNARRVWRPAWTLFHWYHIIINADKGATAKIRRQWHPRIPWNKSKHSKDMLTRHEKSLKSAQLQLKKWLSSPSWIWYWAEPDLTTKNTSSCSSTFILD